MKHLTFIALSIVFYQLAISPCVSADETKKFEGAQPPHLKATVAFTMDMIDFAPIAIPRANPARPEKGFTFLVVGLGPVNTKTKITQTHLDGRIADGKGNTYVPIAFGFPMQGSDKPLTMIGRLEGGHASVVGSEDTFVGLIFVVPESSTAGLTFTTKDGDKQEMKVVRQFKAPKSSRIASLWLKEVSQPAEGKHWEAR